jgi:hypothetical protein
MALGLGTPKSFSGLRPITVFMRQVKQIDSLIEVGMEQPGMVAVARCLFGPISDVDFRGKTTSMGRTLCGHDGMAKRVP